MHQSYNWPVCKSDGGLHLFHNIGQCKLKLCQPYWIVTIEHCVKVLKACLSSTSPHLCQPERSECWSIGQSCLPSTDWPMQCVKVLEACISSTSLVNVDFHDVNFSEVNDDLLVRAISGLQTVVLSRTTNPLWQLTSVSKCWRPASLQLHWAMWSSAVSTWAKWMMSC